MSTEVLTVEEESTSKKQAKTQKVNKEKLIKEAKERIKVIKDEIKTISDNLEGLPEVTDVLPDEIEHIKWGEGKITAFDKAHDAIIVQFSDPKAGTRKLSLSFAAQHGLITNADGSIENKGNHLQLQNALKIKALCLEVEVMKIVRPYKDSSECLDMKVAKEQGLLNLMLMFTSRTKANALCEELKGYVDYEHINVIKAESKEADEKADKNVDENSDEQSDKKAAKNPDEQSDKKAAKNSDEKSDDQSDKKPAKEPDKYLVNIQMYLV